MDERAFREILKKCWSKKSSSLWSSENPSCGQCSVTALVVQEIFGGRILKTSICDRWHFYNEIQGIRYDLTDEQFQTPLNYEDIPSNAEEAFTDTSQEQYEYLRHQVKQKLKQMGSHFLKSSASVGNCSQN
ncbi:MULTISPECIES: YunG family protein [Nostocales]|uniref:Uncharacterized protein n=3 Tax=Nostocales TaxID=1161 RepID=A0A8S9TCH4_9CYAN|nr:hypothetical protein [Tolypothrix bouteillei]KAF3889876.1 hypothetical protein DA73_0400033715 [Tolypothrix bouteillei VB521301]